MPYSYLNYSDDYILDEIPASPNVNKSGRKFYVADTKQINLVVPIAGRLVIGESYSFSASAQLSKPVENSVIYSGINTLSLNTEIKGTISNKVESEHFVTGRNRMIITEGVEVTGKKDFDNVIRKLEKLVDLIEPFGPYDDFKDCLADLVGKGNSPDSARRMCGALQRDLEEDYDDYEWGDEVEEAKYQGRTVKLNKPFRTSGGPKKFAVYVMNKQGNVVIVRFGDPNMDIKRDDPERRKSFRARHNCDQKKDKTSPGYWSCKFWSSKRVGDLA